MSEVIQSILHSIQSDMKQVEIISQNVANAQTAGYKAVQTAPVSFEQLLSQSNDALMVKTLNTSSGALKQTGRPLDVTIEGNGYFVLAEQENTIVLSRNLSLSVSESNELMTQKGQGLGIFVSGLDRSSSGIMIDKNGLVFQKNQNIGALILVDVIDGKQLTQNEKSELVTNSNNVQNTQASVKQGYLEQSNVDSSQELIRLMMLSKHVESNQRTLSTIDQMLDSGINQIGK